MEEFSKNNTEITNRTPIEYHFEVEAKPESQPEVTIAETIDNGRDEDIRLIRQGINKIDKLSEPVSQREGTETTQEKIDRYQKRYLPQYIAKEKGSVANLVTNLFERTVQFESYGIENIPEKGPFVVVCNHFGGGDSEAVLKTFENQNLHLTIAKNRWWGASPIHQWLLKKIGFIPVKESLANISEEEKEIALKKQDKSVQKVFRKIIDREKSKEATIDVDFIHQSIAALANGDAVGIYPEGLWLDPQDKNHEKAELKQGYRGVELLAKQFKKLTGEDLPIIPTAFVEDIATGKKQIQIGKPLFFKDNDTNLNNTDWCMAHIAEMLPEKQRGYYKNSLPQKSSTSEQIM